MVEKMTIMITMLVKMTMMVKTLMWMVMVILEDVGNYDGDVSADVQIGVETTQAEAISC